MDRETNATALGEKSEESKVVGRRLRSVAL